MLIVIDFLGCRFVSNYWGEIEFFDDVGIVDFFMLFVIKEFFIYVYVIGYDEVIVY